MIALWMLYATGVGVVLCLAAAAAERGLRLAERPARGAWVGALVGAVGLPTVAYFLGPLSPVSSVADLLTASRAGGGGVDPAVFGFPGTGTGGGAAAETGRGVTATLLDIAASVDGPLLLLWLALSALLAARLAVEWWRGRSRGWQRSEIAGREVLVASRGGPALAGVLRPQIVVPEWFGELPSELRELALRHEEEHREAGDPWLILGAELARTLLPWNPGIHWAAGRLRRAAELDCDRRLLREGADRGAYGRLLVTVGSRSAEGPAMRRVALTEGTNDLRRRITMLRPTGEVRWRGFRAAGAAAVALAAVAVACEAPVPPTADDGETAAVSRVTERGAATDTTEATYSATAGRLSLDSPDAPLVVVDGAVMDRDVDLAEINAMDIAAVEVIKGDEARAEYGERAANGVVQITTASDRTVERPREEELTSVVVLTAKARMRVPTDTAVAMAAREGVSTGESPLIIVDGVIMGRDFDPEELDAARIDMIEVVKGEAARSLYGDRAKDGIIRITTKDGG